MKAELLDRLADELRASYRVERDAIRALLEARFDAQPKLADELAATDSLERFRRRRVYRDFVKCVRRDVYYSLRQYHSDDASEAVDALEQAVTGGVEPAELRLLLDTVLNAHVSTRERRPFAELYRNVLARWSPGVRTILDAGCGTHPLAFPFDAFPGLTDYVAVDRDAVSLRAVEAYATTLRSVRLKAVRADFEHIDMRGFALSLWRTSTQTLDAPKEMERDANDPQMETPSSLLRSAGRFGTRLETFDLVLMLKTVPVIERQNPALLERLASVPARRALVTASREAMTKRQDVSRRELASLNRFIRLARRRVVDRFDLPNEFGFLLE
jgi:hypothetical protein